MDFHTLSRKELQTLCKKNRIPANMTNVDMADALNALINVEGIEEIRNPTTASEDLQPVGETPRKTETRSPDLPKTCRRTSTRRKQPVKDQVVLIENELPSSLPLTRTLRGTRRRIIQEEEQQKEEDSKILVEKPGEGNITEILATPINQCSRRRTMAASTHQKVATHVEEDKEKQKENTATRVYGTRRSARLAEKKISESVQTKGRGKTEAIKIAELSEEETEDMEKKTNKAPEESSDAFETVLSNVKKNTATRVYGTRQSARLAEKKSESVQKKGRGKTEAIKFAELSEEETEDLEKKENKAPEDSSVVSETVLPKEPSKSVSTNVKDDKKQVKKKQKENTATRVYSMRRSARLAEKKMSESVQKKGRGKPEAIKIADLSEEETEDLEKKENKASEESSDVSETVLPNEPPKSISDVNDEVQQNRETVADIVLIGIEPVSDEVPVNEETDAEDSNGDKQPEDSTDDARQKHVEDPNFEENLENRDSEVSAWEDHQSKTCHLASREAAKDEFDGKRCNKIKSRFEESSLIPELGNFESMEIAIHEYMSSLENENCSAEANHEDPTEKTVEISQGELINSTHQFLAKVGIHMQLKVEDAVPDQLQKCDPVKEDSNSTELFPEQPENCDPFLESSSDSCSIRDDVPEDIQLKVENTVADQPEMDVPKAENTADHEVPKAEKEKYWPASDTVADHEVPKAEKEKYWPASDTVAEESAVTIDEISATKECIPCLVEAPTSHEISATDQTLTNVLAGLSLGAPGSDSKHHLPLQIQVTPRKSSSKKQTPIRKAIRVLKDDKENIDNSARKLESGSGLKSAKLLTLVAEEKENNIKLKDTAQKAFSSMGLGKLRKTQKGKLQSNNDKVRQLFLKGTRAATAAA
ncbi:PREDICTED: uncharacterized protein LOC104612850 isoform X2 [Nelumbo nucifera]|uniref:Uncharacterized protein LOC104612850 isoform X2 n=1 Tax=Nelumbo nucifera TaxID=4432 RepID=A0A1U8BMZ4_NELNU|nr:PREDICTED: uncharacterized protein LOC104612850 isoform X2 [Nelumbo nucifera]